MYTATQRDSERVASYLYNEGIKAKAYHAGQEPAQRRQTQAEFMMNKVRRVVLVATIAFGMGLDKADVRAVINYAFRGRRKRTSNKPDAPDATVRPQRASPFLDTRRLLRSRSLTFCDGVDKPSITKLLQHVFQSGPVTKKARDESEWAPCVGALTASEMEIKLDMRIEAIETALRVWICGAKVSSTFVRKTPHLWTNSTPRTPEGSSKSYRTFDRRARLNSSIDHRRRLVRSVRYGPAAIAKLVPKPRASTYKFKIVEACTHMQTGFDDVASQLKALSKNDGVRYTLADRAVGFEIIRAPPKDVLPLAKALADHCSEIEACSVGKLDALYRAMDEAADTENEEAQGEHLRRCLGAYLDEDSDELPSPPKRQARVESSRAGH